MKKKVRGQQIGFLMENFQNPMAAMNPMSSFSNLLNPVGGFPFSNNPFSLMGGQQGSATSAQPNNPAPQTQQVQRGGFRSTIENTEKILGMYNQASPFIGQMLPGLDRINPFVKNVSPVLQMLKGLNISHELPDTEAKNRSPVSNKGKKRINQVRGRKIRQSRKVKTRIRVSS